MLERLGFSVLIRRDPRTVPSGPGTAVLLAEPFFSAGQEGAGERALEAAIDLARQRNAPVLIVLTKWLGRPHAVQPRWVERAELLGTGDVAWAAGALGGLLETPPYLVRREGVRTYECETDWGDTARLTLQGAQFLKLRPGLESAVSCGEDVLAARVQGVPGGGQFVILSDPDLINNHGLGRGDAALLVEGLLRGGMGVEAVLVDETIHGFTQTRGLLSELFRFPLILLTAQGALLLGLVLWSGMGRFGKPRTPPRALGSGKEILIENTSKLLGVTGNTAWTLPDYFRFTVREVASHYFIPHNLPEEAVLARLSEIGNSRGFELDPRRVKKLVRDLAGGGRQATERAVRLAARLHRWRTEMTHVD